MTKTAEAVSDRDPWEPRADQRAEAAERSMLGLRKRIHQLAGHNQWFERCESAWCHPREGGFDPAPTFAIQTAILNDDTDTRIKRESTQKEEIRTLREALVEIRDAKQICQQNVGSYAGGETHYGFAMRLQRMALTAIARSALAVPQMDSDAD